MLFGTKSTFAIETGEFADVAVWKGVYVQFRLWIAGEAIGDWTDRIPLVASAGYAKMFMDARQARESQFRSGSESSSELFENIHTAFLEWDYRVSPRMIPDLRDLFIIEDIGMGAIVDKYGIIVAQCSPHEERIIAKDYRNGDRLLECRTSTGTACAAIQEYYTWAQTILKGTEPQRNAE